MPIMGVETVRFNPSVIGHLQEAGISWIRRNGLLWALVEPNEGDRLWGQVTTLEQDLQTAASQGIQVILIVRRTPSWAQQTANNYCGRIKPEKLGAFAQFMQDLVARYSAPPFNVKYWEIWNEPDIDPSLVIPDSVYGCWGDQADDYYGGGYYAEMLKAVYPAIKAADPQAQVLIGGLLLNCDPVYPPPGNDCKSSKFFEGILRNGGGDYFDIVSFHGYPPYDGSTQMEEHYPGWYARGGVVVGKADFLREVMAAYGVNKPLILTEGSLICPEWNPSLCNSPDAVFYEAQADYVIQLYVRNWAAGIGGTIWFQLEGPGWRYGSLLNAYQFPKPAFDAYKFLSQELKGANYMQTLMEYPNLRTFEFSRPDKRIWVVWSPDDLTYTIDLPPNTRVVLDKYGNSITPVNGQLSVKSPVFIELQP